MAVKHAYQPTRQDFLIAFGLFGFLGLVILWLVFFSQLDWQEPYHDTSAVADLNGDGNLDVIVANTRWEGESTSWAGVTLWLNQGGGKFSSSPVAGGFSAAAGDVDGDGDADILVLDGYTLTPYLNQGGAQGGKNGEFKANNGITPAIDWHGHTDMGGSVVLGDLNNDGEVDGFVAGCCYMVTQTTPAESYLNPSSSWVWLNAIDPRGWPWMERHTLTLPELEGVPIQATALGDLNGDGRPDVFAAIGTPKPSAGSRLANRVLVNDGAGNFTDSGQRLGSANNTSVALGDVDGDGDLDALVGTESGAVLWINQGGAQGGKAGTFVASENKLARRPISAVFLQDLNDDGKPDALLGGVAWPDLWYIGDIILAAGESQAEIWWNDGHGTFKPSDQRFSYPNRHALAVADFNGDGYADIFAGGFTDNYKVWLNQGNGSGQFR
jgi:hypothetical protein